MGICWIFSKIHYWCVAGSLARSTTAKALVGVAVDYPVSLLFADSRGELAGTTEQRPGIEIQ